MNIYDFVTKLDFEKIRKAVGGKEEFRHIGEYRDKSGSIELDLHGDILKDESLINGIWHGHDYLVHLHIMHKTKELGWGGCGSAEDDMGLYGDWEVFKSYVDGRMKNALGDLYEVEEVGQMSLF